MTSGNVACAFCGRGPVIGQCPGYEVTCGRNYCARHQIGKYCEECGKRKEDDDRQADFKQTAEQLWKELEKSRTRPAKAVAGAILLALFFCTGFITLAGADAALPFLVVVIMLLIALIFVQHQRRSTYSPKIEQARVQEIEQSKPGFASFYLEWSNDKERTEQTDSFLLFLGAFFVPFLVALGLASAATQESDDDRIRRITREEHDRFR